METTVKNDFINILSDIGPELEKNSVGTDKSDRFVKKNYDLLKENGYLSAMIPEDLGGGGLTHGQMCNILRHLGHYCSSSALALSMHQHLLAANIWKYVHGKGGEKVLAKVARENLVLVSTGAKDWLNSNGILEKTDDGYLFSAKKHFASQSPAGDMLVTSAPYNDPEKGWQVLHFAVPMQQEGISIIDNWYAMGMRGTGSNTIKIENVFIPDSSIVLRRPKGEYHPFWNVILCVALPLIMSAYVGIAEKAVEQTLENLRKKDEYQSHIPFLTGEMNNSLTNARIILNDMINIANNFNFDPKDIIGHEMLTRKTLVANACLFTVQKAMELTGGMGYFRSSGLERLYRDVNAGIFHPLPEKEQQRFSGEFLLG